MDKPELDYYSEGSEPDERETWAERANDAVEEVRGPRSSRAAFSRPVLAGHDMGLYVPCKGSSSATRVHNTPDT